MSDIVDTTRSHGALFGILNPAGALVGKIQTNGGSGISYEIGSGLIVEGNVLRVDTAEAVEADNTRPVTSAAVYTELGNIEALLANL